MAGSRYPVVADRVEVETEVLNSRFLATLERVDTKAEAQALVAELRQTHPEANHHCYAFVVGPPGSTRCVGFSDAGEPHNTAGRPMFDVLVHSGLGDVACVVTRWFGGTKLGRGGLVRAYGDAVQEALGQAERVDRVVWRKGVVDLDYAQVDGILRWLPELGAEVLDRSYGARVRFELRVPEEAQGQLARELADRTRGAASWAPEDPNAPE